MTTPPPPAPSLGKTDAPTTSPGAESERDAMIWRGIASAPKDGTSILAVVTADKTRLTDRWDHLAGRMFVVWHLGITASDFDMGWALFPGMGVGEDWLTHWMPLPPPPAKAVKS